MAAAMAGIERRSAPSGNARPQEERSEATPSADPAEAAAAIARAEKEQREAEEAEAIVAAAEAAEAEKAAAEEAAARAGVRVPAELLRGEPKHAIGAELLVQRSDGSFSECTVLAYDAERNAYQVKMEGSDVKKMASENMLMPRGAAPSSVAASPPTPAPAATPTPQQQPSRVYSRGDVVFYTTGAGEQVVAQIVGVHNETTPPHYTILAEGSERQTEGDRLAPLDVFDGDGGGGGGGQQPTPSPQQPTPASQPTPTQAAPYTPPPQGYVPARAPAPAPPPQQQQQQQQRPPPLRETTKRSSFPFFGGGSKDKRKSDAGLDTSLPKHLEPQGNEIARLARGSVSSRVRRSIRRPFRRLRSAWP